MHNEVNKSTVHGHVVQAGSIGEVHLHGGEVPYPPLTSWQDRPELTDELRDLLHVQHDAAETLPYRLLGVKQPELTRVYVQQSVRHEKEDSGERKHEPPVSVEEALGAGTHLLITGEPGAGKSTLSQMYVQRLAKAWLEETIHPPLREPVLPVRVPAKALADELPWSELLANAVRDRRLNAPLPAALFAKRALGARWLVFVDGLDEIAEPERRARVIDAIATRVRRGTEHRIVIMTRPLPPDELKQLHSPHLEHYTIQPFSPVELREFAWAWFHAQDPIQARARTDEFVRQVHDGRLRELVRNPLLATIAAITTTLEPGRALPHNRVDLYERFMTYLMDGTASGRELRQSHHEDPERRAQTEWLHAHRHELIAHLAVERMESERSLLDIATEWVDRPHETEDLLAVLTSTGILVHADGGLRYLHHSFAEFLAARARAAEIPADFPDLDDWVGQGVRMPARENSVLFTFVLWGREDGHDLDLVLQRLLAGGTNHALLAGKLLAEYADVSTHLVDEAADRLVELLLANGVGPDPWIEHDNITRMLGGLGGNAIAGVLEPRLRELRDAAELPPSVRICCAVALGHLGSATDAAKWLREFTDASDPFSLHAIADGLAGLLPDGAEVAEALVVGWATANNSPAEVMTAAEVLLTTLERPESAAALFRRLVAEMKVHGAVEPLGTHRHRYDGDRDGDPHNWGALASLAAEAGCTDEALWAAEQVFAQPWPADDQFGRAARVMLECAGEAAVTRIEQRAQELSFDHVLAAARRLAAFGSDRAMHLAQLVAHAPAASADQFVRACEQLAAFAPDLVVWLVDERGAIDPDDLLSLAGVLTAYGASGDHLVRRALSEVAARPGWFGPYLLESVDLAELGPAVFESAAAGSPAHWAGAAPVLHRRGFTDQAADLIDRLLTEPVDAEEVATCLSALVYKDVPDVAQPLFAKAVELAEGHRPEVALLLVRALNRIGRRDDAVRLARETFVHSVRTDDLNESVITLLEVAGSGSGEEIVQTVLAADLTAELRMGVADRFLWHGSLKGAVALWLDVVRRHRDVPETGIKAANFLVRCGYRQQALETVRAAMAEDLLTGPARAQLRAVEAWLAAIVPE